MMEIRGGLEGVRVLELGHYIAGPFAAQVLADQGADVIKIESPGANLGRGPDQLSYESVYFDALNRNKRSVELNLKSSEGLERFLELVETADALITNFAAGVPERLGVGFDQLQRRNDQLVYVHITGFGVDSPYAARPAFDGVIQSMAGLSHLTGEPDGPPMQAGLFIPDHVTGLYAALAVTFGLRRRELEGHGSFADLSMLDAMLSFLAPAFAEVLQLGENPGRVGSRVRRSYAGTYQTKDDFVYLAPLDARMWAGVANVVGHPELTEYFSGESGSIDTRLQHRTELDAVIERWTRTQSTDEVVELMTASGVPASPVFDIPAIVADPNVAHRRMLRKIPMPGGVGEVYVPGSPLPVVEGTYRVPPPIAGEHTDEVLRDLHEAHAVGGGGL